jgi:hypothetical protein
MRVGEILGLEMLKQGEESFFLELRRRGKELGF